jgi:hypothetical protein
MPDPGAELRKLPFPSVSDEGKIVVSESPLPKIVAMHPGDMAVPSSVAFTTLEIVGVPAAETIPAEANKSAPARLVLRFIFPLLRSYTMHRRPRTGRWTKVGANRPSSISRIFSRYDSFAELIVPFLFFARKRFRHVAAWIVIGLQVLILLTGNYTFFNLLAIILTLFLFIDPAPAPTGRVHLAVSIALIAFIGIVSGCVTLQMFSVDIPGESAVLRTVEPLRIVNSYGLFAVMTTERPEIIVEGSNDGSTWLAYEFRYKPGDLRRAPPIVAPHQPRLDWQMWFAALGIIKATAGSSASCCGCCKGSRAWCGRYSTIRFPTLRLSTFARESSCITSLSSASRGGGHGKSAGYTFRR